MSSEERVYTINLGKALLSQSQHRAVRAINMIREFASKHMRSGDVKIDEDLAHQIWARGARSPPRRIRVKMWTGDSGEIIVSRYDGEDAVGAKPPAEPEKPAVPEPALADAAATTDLEPAKTGDDVAKLDDQLADEDQPVAETPAEPEPAAEKPDEPDKDQHVAEKPAAQEPAAEKPAEPADKNKPVAEESAEQKNTQDKN